MRQVTDFHALGRPGFALKVLVFTRHDTQQRGLTRPVDTDDTDLGIRQEIQVNVLEHLLATGICLGQALHLEYDLGTGH